MNRIRNLCLLSAVFCAPAFAQPPSIAHIENIDDWRISARVATDAPATPAVSARFSAFGQSFELELEPNQRVAAMFDSNSDARAYRGELRGVPESWVRLVISSAGVSGVIWDGANLFGVEPTADAEVAMFRAADVVVPAGTMSCGMHAPVDNAAVMFAELAGETPEIGFAAGATVNMNLGIVSDPEFGVLYADPEAAMMTRVNNVDGIYSEQLGIQLTVERVDVFDDAASDPFSDTVMAEDLLEELSYFRADTPEQDAQGLTHLFTGRDLDGSTVGVAYIGAICAQRSPFNPTGPSFGVGLTQANFGPAGALLESLIAAHEIGHNFGAPHDGEAGDVCEDEPATGFIMAAALDVNADDFSQCSIDVITDAIPGASCITPIATVNAAIDGASNVAAPLTETQFGYTVSVTNEGLETATGTSVQVDFAAGLSVLSVTPQAGSCGPAQSSVTCSPGDIPAASTRTITFTLQADAAGDYSIDGSVTATDDVDATNDSFSDSVTVAPASDLALITNDETLTQDEAETIIATLENRSGVDASNVALTGSWSDGLDVSSVSFGGNDCTIDSGLRSLDCQIGALSGLSSGDLSITLIGSETGSEVVTLNVSAQESDPNAANNSSNVAVEIVAASAPPPASNPGSDPAAQDSGGGGGSLGPFSLLALLAAWQRSRRCRRRNNANFS